jgi:hypothetical protein
MVAALSFVGTAIAQVPAGSTGLCKDGSYWTGPTKQGACRGHKGVQTWYGGTAAAAPSAPMAPAKPMASAPATTGPAPSGSTGLCKDGSYWTGTTKQGACRGHKGVQTWFGGTAAATAPAAPAQPMASPPMAPARAATRAPAAVAPPAPGGGSGQVWVNTTSKVYHCPGDRYYGNTKAGSYMTEQAAIAAGDRPDHGKACH